MPAVTFGEVLSGSRPFLGYGLFPKLHDERLTAVAAIEQCCSLTPVDSYCAAMGDHSDKAAKACTLSCVKDGALFVLYNSADQSIYQLDDQKKPQEFAGQKVKVTGTLDKASKKIHVTGIQAGA